MTYNKLTPQEEDIILGKGTETPFSGEFKNQKMPKVLEQNV